MLMPELKHDLGGTFTSPRNEGLDGIRGLAALSVALGHCYLVAFGLDIWRATVRDLFTLVPEDIGYRLLSLAFPADPAVMVFFVLSGNVLWQSFVRKRLSCGSFLDYVLSRLWRLMPPIAAATVLMDYFHTSFRHRALRQHTSASYECARRDVVAPGGDGW
jgi:peptidoglycan/LPS O-acetylase OafA/YrhL